MIRRLKGKFLFRRRPLYSQLDLGINQEVEPDRNHARGGRSFYFFDFDDNVATLTTPIFLFHKETGSEIRLSSREYGEQSVHVGKRGSFKDFELRFDDAKGSFRCFRDKDIGWLERLLGRKQPFVEDVLAALGLEEFHWQGPSWSCFRHAVLNQRPLALITARGHSPSTMKDAVRVMVREGHLPYEPNYLALFPVSHPEVRSGLGGDLASPIPKLKKSAIRAAVQAAFAVYGYNPHHRFGMSDDDPANVELIIDEMVLLKKEWPEVSFFVIETHRGQFIKREIFPNYTVDQILLPSGTQLPLFDD